MILLDPHDGDLGMSAWVDCARCCPRWDGTQQPGWCAGWCVILAGERHWIDRATRHHFHASCGLALVDAGQAEIRDVSAAVTEKKRMARAALKPRVKEGSL
jgi:hypothetical protein